MAILQVVRAVFSGFLSASSFQFQNRKLETGFSGLTASFQIDGFIIVFSWLGGFSIPEAENPHHSPPRRFLRSSLKTWSGSAASALSGRGPLGLVFCSLMTAMNMQMVHRAQKDQQGGGVAGLRGMLAAGVDGSLGHLDNAADVDPAHMRLLIVNQGTLNDMIERIKNIN